MGIPYLPFLLFRASCSSSSDSYSVFLSVALLPLAIAGNMHLIFRRRCWRLSLPSRPPCRPLPILLHISCIPLHVLPCLFLDIPFIPLANIRLLVSPSPLLVSSWSSFIPSFSPLAHLAFLATHPSPSSVPRPFSRRLSRMLTLPSQNARRRVPARGLGVSVATDGTLYQTEVLRDVTFPCGARRPPCRGAGFIALSRIAPRPRVLFGALAPLAWEAAAREAGDAGVGRQPGCPPHWDEAGDERCGSRVS
ncbi:hypothetical protein B0H10DRAFT_1032088 [Mycena sp. CBHHK59/15]|nr:hypothetical protein B0H10DRAFT_1032088 [Mycena sp. CBHHK59/15]